MHASLTMQWQSAAGTATTAAQKHKKKHNEKKNIYENGHLKLNEKAPGQNTKRKQTSCFSLSCFLSGKKMAFAK